MTPWYLAMPATRKPEVPPSLLPQLRFSHCAGCRQEVIYHGRTVDRMREACRQSGQALRIICPTCAAKEPE